MKKFFVLLIFLLISGSVMAQGSPGVLAPVYTKVGDTLVVIASTGDTVILYDSSSAVVQRIRGTATYWVFPNLFHVNDLEVQSSATIAGEATINTIIMDNGITNGAPIYSFTGNGLELVNGLLTATLGATVEGSDITNQTIGKSDIDTTIANMVFAALYKKTSAVPDSAYQTKYYIDHYLMGYALPSVAPGSQYLLRFNSTSSTWEYTTAGGSGSSTLGFDTTFAAGGIFTPASPTIRGDTGLINTKRGSDTILQQIDFARVQRNDGSRDVRIFRDSLGDDTMLRMIDSGIYTAMTTSNNAGFSFQSPVHISGNLIFDGATRSVGGVWFMYGPDDAQPMYLSDSSSLALQAIHVDKAVTIGSSINWTFDADSAYGRGSQSKLFGLGRISVDTVNSGITRVPTLKNIILAGGDTAKITTRDTANNVTTDSTTGTQRHVADPGLVLLLDSGRISGRWYLEDTSGTGGTIDSGLRVQADSMVARLILKLAGTTSGSVRFKARAVGGSSIYTVPPDSTSGLVLTTDGAGNLYWGASGSGGGGGPVKWDTAAVNPGRDVANLKMNSDSIAMTIQRLTSDRLVLMPQNGLSMYWGDTLPGMPVMDSALKVKNFLTLGTTDNDTARLNAGRLYNLRRNDIAFNAGNLSFKPEQSLTKGVKFTDGMFPDTVGTTSYTGVDSTCIDWLCALMDTSGSDASFSPIRFVIDLAENDSLFTFVISAKTSVADTALAGITKAVLVVNEVPVDSVTGASLNFSSTSLTTTTINFADQSLSAHDRILIKLYCRTNPAAAARSISIKKAYLTMRRR